MMGILGDCSQAVRTSSHGTKIKKELSATGRTSERKMAFVQFAAGVLGGFSSGGIFLFELRTGKVPSIRG